MHACYRLAAVAALFATAATARADEPRVIQTERLSVAYSINADGTYTETREQATKLLDTTALQYAKDQSIGFSQSIQSAEIVEAYTLKADGRRVAVPSSNFQTTTNTGKGDGSPMYSDHTTLTAVYPDLAVGDTVVFKSRVVAKTPMFEGQFSEIESYPRFDYVGDLSIHVDVPAAMPLKIEAWQLDKRVDAVRDGRRVLEWHYANTTPGKAAEYGAYDVTRNPGVAMSTFASYSAIAEAYAARAVPKAAVTPRIARLANEIAGTATGRDAARKLYEWVATTITYGGNCIGLGAVVPRDLDLVLDNKMGDCKDHATLLQALLAAKGIDSRQALINATSAYALPTVPVVSMVNHVINYLPAFDLYVDSTANGVPFGMLPRGDAGKPVLLVGGPAGAHTPAVKVGEARQVARTRMKVAADGSVSGEMRVELAGMYAAEARSSLRAAPKEAIARSVDAFFKRMGTGGRGTLDFEDPRPLTDRFAYTLHFDVQRLLSTPGTFALQPPFGTQAPIAGFASQGIAEVESEGDDTCSSAYSEETYEIEFDPALKLLVAPKAVNVQNDTISYRSTYDARGQTLVASRVLDDRTPGPLCTPAYNRLYREQMLKVLEDVKAQVVYQ